MIRDGSNPPLLKKINRTPHSLDSRSVDDDAAIRVSPQRLKQHIHLFTGNAFFDDIRQVRPVKAGNVLVSLAKLQLLQDIVAHAPGGARSESGNRGIGKLCPQPA